MPAACGIMRYARVMACYKNVEIKLPRAQKEQVKLYMTVTFNAGIGGPALFISFYKCADNLLSNSSVKFNT